MRIALCLLIVGCSGRVTRRGEDAGTTGPRDAGSSDGGASPDAAGIDAATIDAATIDAATIDAATIDAGPTCTPTRTSCNTNLECGPIPNGCPGGVFACDPCGGPETYCAVQTSQFQARVYNCTQAAQTNHPEYFDPVMFRDTSSWLVLDAFATAYVADVAACCSASGAVCIADPNGPGNEVRARDAAGDLAENFIVRTYGTGRTAGRYTSSCTPAFF